MVLRAAVMAVRPRSPAIASLWAASSKRAAHKGGGDGPALRRIRTPIRIVRPAQPKGRQLILRSSHGASAAAAPPPALDLATEPAIFYADAGLRRCAEHRLQPEWQAAELASPTARVVPVWRTRSLVRDGRAVLLEPSTVAKSLATATGGPIILGIAEGDVDGSGGGYPLFAVDVSADEDESCAQEQTSSTLAAGARWVDLRREGPSLPARDAGLLAYARGLVEWQARHDPAVIMLVTAGNHVLLGRQARWEKGRYSLLAGFVEIGETFEMAVKREVEEEAGVEVDIASVRYEKSQPWPFPQSLMIGFTGQAVMGGPSEEPRSGNGSLVSSDTIELPESAELLTEEHLPAVSADKKELEDARWVHKDFIRAIVQDNKALLPQGTNFFVPGKYAIARVLLERWACTPISESSPRPGDELPTVEIDTGTFKYVLLRASDASGNSKLIVRGYTSAPYHMDVFATTQRAASLLGIKVEPLGGGRMEHEAEDRRLHIYGYSQAYGRADHCAAAVLCRRWLPLHTVSSSNEGY
eukprot:SM000282S10611  [mRNA]  locus=s282:129231:134059:- [translate_table: standard]